MPDTAGRPSTDILLWLLTATYRRTEHYSESVQIRWNQIRDFLIERGIAVRQRPVPLRKALHVILAADSVELSPRILCLLEDLAADWRRLAEPIETSRRRLRL